MNRYYIIVPVILMGLFVFFERGASQDAAIKEKAKIESESKEKAKKEAEKKALEEKAKVDSEKRNEERLKDEQEKEVKRKAEYDAKIQRLRDEAKKYTDALDQNTKLVATLEKNLADLRDRREKENREVLEFAKKVEISKKMRRNAELEVQRYNEMLSRRASESILAKSAEVAATPRK